MALQLRFSGGTANIDPDGSLGGQMSTTTITDDTVDNLFDSITRGEALIGRTEYRCLYVFNTGAGLLTGVTAQVTVNPTITQVSIGTDPAGRGDGVNDGVAISIGTEDTTPAGVHFFGEENTDDGRFNIVYNRVILPIGHLKASEGQAFWFKRKTETGIQQTISLTIVLTHDAVAVPGKSVDDGGAIGDLIWVDTVVSGQYKIGSMRVGLSNLG